MNLTKDWNQYADQKCVKYINKTLGFIDAKKYCHSLNGELLSIHSEEENNYLTALIADKPSAFIGYNSITSNNNIWGWDDQTKVTYTNWGVIKSTFNYRCIIMS